MFRLSPRTKSFMLACALIMPRGSSSLAESIQDVRRTPVSSLQTTQRNTQKPGNVTQGTSTHGGHNPFSHRLLREITSILNERPAPATRATQKELMLCLGSRVMYPIPLIEPRFRDLQWNISRPPPLPGRDAQPLAAATAMMDDGRYGDASRMLRTLLDTIPGGPNQETTRLYLAEAQLLLSKKARPSIRKKTLQDLQALLPDTEALTPPAMHALYSAAKAWMDLQEYDQAARDFQRLLNMLPRHDATRYPILLSLGVAHYRAEAYRHTVETLLKAIIYAPPQDAADLVLAIATAEAKQNRFDHVDKLLRVTMNYWPERTQELPSLLLTAETAYRLDRLDTALDAWKRVAQRLGTTMPHIYRYRLGEVLILKKQFDDALHFFLGKDNRANAQSEDPDRQWEQAMRSLRRLQIRMRTDTPQKRRTIHYKNLSRMVLERPRVPIAAEVALELTYFHLLDGNPDQALISLKSLLAQYPDISLRREIVNKVWESVQTELTKDYEAEEYFKLIGLYEQAFQIVGAEQVYNSDIALTVARTYEKLEQYRAAYELLGLAIFLKGSEAKVPSDYFLLLAELRRKTGEYDEARRILHRLESDNSKTIRAAIRRQRALINEAENRRAEAASEWMAYARIVNSQSDAIEAYHRAGRLMEEERGCAGALQAYKSAAKIPVELDNSDLRSLSARAHISLGRCLYELHYYKQASLQLTQALALDPNHRDQAMARYFLGASFIYTNRIHEGQILLNLLSHDRSNGTQNPWNIMAKDMISQLKWKDEISDLRTNK